MLSWRPRAAVSCVLYRAAPSLYGPEPPRQTPPPPLRGAAGQPACRGGRVCLSQSHFSDQSGPHTAPNADESQKNTPLLLPVLLLHQPHSQELDMNLYNPLDIILTLWSFSILIFFKLPTHFRVFNGMLQFFFLVHTIY